MDLVGKRKGLKELKRSKERKVLKGLSPEKRLERKLAIAIRVSRTEAKQQRPKEAKARELVKAKKVSK